MPQFSTPFEGMVAERELTVPELVRALRFAIASEYEAVQIYQQLAESIADKEVQAALISIANEERVHVGELFRLVVKLDPEEHKLFMEGIKEVETEFIKKAD